MKMKRFLLVVLSLLLLLAFGCSKDTNNSSVTNPNPNTVYPKGYLQGKVVDACSRAPIVGAVVDIGIKKATTNSDGEYFMKDVPATSYVDRTDIDVNFNLDTLATDTTTLKKKDDPDVSTAEVEADADAHVDIDSGYRGRYSATIDMTKATIGGVAVTIGAGGYADHYYKDVSVQFASLEPSSGILSADNADVTPVLGLGNGDYDFLLGKLNTGITGYVVDTKMQPMSNYVVYLFSTLEGDDGNSFTGGSSNKIARVVTDSAGKFIFSNVEANQKYGLMALDVDTAAPLFQGFAKIGTACNGSVLNLGIQDAGAIVVSPTDILCPFVLSARGGVSAALPDGHANYADIAKEEIAAGVNVVFTFSEPILATELNTGRALLATSDTDSMKGLYKDIAVMYEGNKDAEPIHHTLTWNEGMTKLTVFIPAEALQPAAMYSVTITSVEHLTDVTENQVTSSDPGTTNIGGCPYTKNVQYNFTTWGARAAAQVTGLHAYLTGHPEETQFDYDDHATIDWTAVDGAKRYNVYCRMIQWNTTTAVPCGTDTYFGQYHPYFKVGETELTGFDLNFQGTGGFYTEHESYEFEYVESLNIKLSYQCYVLGVDADGIEGATPSLPVLIEDTDPPYITKVQQTTNGSSWSDIGSGTSGTVIDALRVCFSEPMNEYFVEPRPPGDTTSVGHATWLVNAAAFTTNTGGYGAEVATYNYVPRDLCLYITFNDKLTAELKPPQILYTGTAAACPTATAGQSVTTTVLSLTAGTLKDVAGNLLLDPCEHCIGETAKLPATFSQIPVYCKTPGTVGNPCTDCK